MSTFSSIGYSQLYITFLLCRIGEDGTVLIWDLEYNKKLDHMKFKSSVSSLNWTSKAKASEMRLLTGTTEQGRFFVHDLRMNAKKQMEFVWHPDYDFHRLHPKASTLVCIDLRFTYRFAFLKVSLLLKRKIEVSKFCIAHLFLSPCRNCTLIRATLIIISCSAGIMA